MLLAGTVVADPDTVIDDGAVVVEDDTITAVGDESTLVDRYTDHERREFGIVAPGTVGGHIHSVQSLGRGIADDVALLDWLEEYVLPMEAGLGPDGTRLAAELGYLECIESGVTTVIDHLSVHHAEEALSAAVDSGIRARAGKVLMDTNAPDGLRQKAEHGLAETEALIWRFHGADGGRIRYAITPRFAVTCTEECLRGCRDLADEYDGVRIHTHASENTDEIAVVEERTGERNIAFLDEVGLTGEDVVLAHCVHTDEDERELIAETGTHVTHCPSSNMKLASGIAPVEDYLDRGVNVALGNDGPPCNNTLDPFTELKQASLLAKVDALDPTAVDASTALRMATLNGARAAGFEHVGALREGWKADVLGIDTDHTRATPLHDPIGHLVFAAHGDDVAFTMVDGDVLYDEGAGGHRTLDAERVRREANAFDVPGVDA
ncbi:5'-deoxyadenosine deaminase [Halobaculum gomorrense]|uniref:Cytosine/adenosine deaminase n=1 Tax=Halobaculum gomorrense TaxID=43928 RepID=A0A1M5P3H3_9EURY|nr:5'-deoxyadenosine deaminase [Halobaculum gomorrense]SHG96376.1 Cytosine/adenosine deaminase [Halobaculum gomorrense]